MSNTVDLNVATLKPVTPETVEAMIGTEPNHYFVVNFRVGDIQAGGRFLDEDATLCVTNDKRGRVRVEGVPVSSPEERFLTSLGMTRKSHSRVTPQHISGVTDNPAALLAFIQEGLEIIESESVSAS